MDGALREIDFLSRSKHRVQVLDALAEGPLDRAKLCARTGASSPTMGRILSAFRARRWIQEDGPGYALTPLGAYVRDRFAQLHDAMQTELTLREVWPWLPREMEGFRVSLFEDAVVSYPGPGYPYEPVERMHALIRETSTMRGFGSAVFKSVTNRIVCERVLDGMEHEYIYAPETLEATVAWDPQRVAQAAARQNCTVLVHEDLPDEKRCGLGIFDDRVGICCHDADTGALEAIVDTGDPKAREWALSLFERYRKAARTLSADDKRALFPEEVIA